jgi:S1-C subfamily serine protease
MYNIIIVLAVFLVGCPTVNTKYHNKVTNTDNYPTDAMEMTQYYRKSVFRVSFLCGREVIAFGTAFKVGSKVVATNRHLFDLDCRRGLLPVLHGVGVNDTLAIRTAYVVKRAKIHTKQDVALLETHQVLPGVIIPVPNTVIPDAATPVLSLSYPLGRPEIHTILGYVTLNSRWEAAQDGKGDFATSLSIDSGSSGSPVFSQLTGELVGIVTSMRIDSTAAATFVLRADHINDLHWED